MNGDIEAFKEEREKRAWLAEQAGATSDMVTGTWHRAQRDLASPRAGWISRVELLWGLRGWKCLRVFVRDVRALPVDELTADDVPAMLDVLDGIREEAARHRVDASCLDALGASVARLGAA